MLAPVATRFLSEQSSLYWFKKNILALHRFGEPSPFEPANRTLALVSRPAADVPGEPMPPALDAATVVSALDHLRAAYAKIEARLDELHHAKTDVLINQALSEYRTGLLALSGVAKASGPPSGGAKG